MLYYFLIRTFGVLAADAPDNAAALFVYCCFWWWRDQLSTGDGSCLQSDTLRRSLLLWSRWLVGCLAVIMITVSSNGQKYLVAKWSSPSVTIILESVAWSLGRLADVLMTILMGTGRRYLLSKQCAPFGPFIVESVDRYSLDWCARGLLWLATRRDPVTCCWWVATDDAGFSWWIVSDACLFERMCSRHASSTTI